MQKLQVTLREGLRIYVDSWTGYKWSNLVKPDDFDFQFFGDRINFRLPSGSFTNVAYAIKLEVTGRTLQYKFNEPWVIRGKITWITDDGQNQESSPCWIVLEYDDFEYIS
jgi:hypothetical protein